MDVKPYTIKALLENTVRRFPNQPSLGLYNQPPFTYSQLGEKVAALSTLLKAQGVQKGDRVALLGENSPQWGIAYLAIVTMGAIVVPILPGFPADDIQIILKHSEARILFVSHKQMEKVFLDKNKYLQRVVFLDDFTLEHSPLGRVVSLSRLLEEARHSASSLIHSFGEKTGLLHTASDVNENDPAAIIYTSGTLGLSKGVILTHKNLVTNTMAVTHFYGFDQNDRLLSLLPLSHAYETVIGFLCPLAKGSSVTYLGKVPSPQLLKEACASLRPTVMPMVPLLLEKLYKKKVLPLFTKNLVMKGITSTSWGRRLVHRKAAAKIKEFFGGELISVVLGGAPLSREVEEFMLEGNFPYSVGYGLTETAPIVTGIGPGLTRLGSCGKALFNVEIAIRNPDPLNGVGEIYVRGPNVMKGYFKNRELTEETIDHEGWLRTGDRGFLDKDGYLFIRGRSKNLILTGNGENVYPEVIEERLNAHPWVGESLVLSREGKIEALVYLEAEKSESLLAGCTENELDKRIESLLEEIRHQVNRNLSASSAIRKLYYQSEPFEKTPTQKIKRYLYDHSLPKSGTEKR